MATVTINGQELSTGQAMALWAAINNFVPECGDDAHGKAMNTAYAERITEVQQIWMDTETETFGDGLCCLAAHANAKAPWTCPCACHKRRKP